MSYNFNPYNCNCKNPCQSNNNCKNDCKNDCKQKDDKKDNSCNQQSSKQSDKNKGNDKNKNKHENCNCYKKALRESLELLSCSPFNSYVNFSSFTLYGQSYSTATNATTLKSIVSCNCDLIEYTDGSQFNTASLCDLVGYSFQILNPTSNLPLFLSSLQDYLCCCKGQCNNCCCPQPSCVCDCDCDSCCCNDSKAAKLNSLLGPVNLYVKGTLGTITGATLLAVVDDIAWVSTTTTSGSPAVTTTTIFAIPLYNIEFLG